MRLPSTHPDGSGGRGWDLGVSTHEAIRRARDGDLTIGGQVSASLDRLQPVYSSDALGVVWDPAMVGPRVDVPAFLAGAPRTMRARRTRETNARMVHVYVDVVSSVTLSAKDLLSRGITVLALIENLQRLRYDVDLTLVCSMSSKGGREECMALIPLEAKPLDLSVAGFALAHPSFPRNVIYQVARKECPSHDAYLSPGFLRYRRDPPGYDKWIRDFLSLEPMDIFIPLSFGGDPIFRDPSRWLQERVTQICPS